MQVFLAISFSILQERNTSQFGSPQNLLSKTPALQIVAMAGFSYKMQIVFKFAGTYKRTLPELSRHKTY